MSATSIYPNRPTLIISGNTTGLSRKLNLLSPVTVMIYICEHVSKVICVRISCKATQSPKRQCDAPKPNRSAFGQTGLWKNRSRISILAALLTLAMTAGAQQVAIKTNALYMATGTPNIGAELGLNRTSTVNVEASYNPWKPDEENVTKYQKLVHLRIEGEYRRWLWERFNGHFFGAHGIYSTYDISGRTVPFLFNNEHAYKGTAYGLGVSYGFHLMLGSALGIEAFIGMGAMRLSFDKSACLSCLPPREQISETYIGPTKIGVSLIYIIK